MRRLRKSTVDDHGKTWSERKWLSTNADGQPSGVALGLTDLGGGKLLVFVDEMEAIQNREKYAPRFPGWRKW